MSNSPVLEAILTHIRAHGYGPTARLLKTDPATLGQFLAGTAREGTALLLTTRWEALQVARAATAAAPPIDGIEPGLGLRA